MLRREVIAKNVSVYTKDKKKLYKNKQLYYTKYTKDITGLSVRLAGSHMQVNYIGNGFYQLRRNIDWSK